MKKTYTLVSLLMGPLIVIFHTQVWVYGLELFVIALWRLIEKGKINTVGLDQIMLILNVLGFLAIGLGVVNSSEYPTFWQMTSVVAVAILVVNYATIFLPRK